MYISTVHMLAESLYVKTNGFGEFQCRAVKLGRGRMNDLGEEARIQLGLTGRMVSQVMWVDGRRPEIYWREGGETAQLGKKLR